jgi:hybrid cluster-associated redox disulfide protein
VEPNQPPADLTVAALLATQPATIHVFLRRRMACVGCVFAPFETLQDAARAYDMPLDAFLDDLAGAIRRDTLRLHNKIHEEDV